MSNNCSIWDIDSTEPAYLVLVQRFSINGECTATQVDNDYLFPIDGAGEAITFDPDLTPLQLADAVQALVDQPARPIIVSTSVGVTWWNQLHKPDPE